MFAVPGWTLPLSHLQLQPSESKKKVEQRKLAPPKVEYAYGPDAKPKKGVRQRKRKRGMDDIDIVTAGNLGEMWSRHIEGAGVQGKDKDKVEGNAPEADHETQSEVSTEYNAKRAGPSDESDILSTEVETGKKSKKQKRGKGSGDDDTTKSIGSADVKEAEGPTKEKKEGKKSPKEKKRRVEVDVQTHIGQISDVVTGAGSDLGEGKKNMKEDENGLKEEGTKDQIPATEKKSKKEKKERKPKEKESVVVVETNPSTKPAKEKKDKKAKKEMIAGDNEATATLPKNTERMSNGEGTGESAAEASASTPARAKKEKKLARKEGSDGSSTQAISEPSKSSNSKSRSRSSDIPAASRPKLTPLQQKMADKLLSARFRHLNETLYTNQSSAALELFRHNPESYDSYHIGFRAQVQTWPSNPINTFIALLRTRSKIRRPNHGAPHNRQPAPPASRTQGVPGPYYTGNAPAPSTLGLPRFRGADGPGNTIPTCKIVDLGCGDASFAAAVQDLQERQQIAVQSFDLAPGSGPHADLVTVADITDLSQIGPRAGKKAGMTGIGAEVDAEADAGADESTDGVQTASQNIAICSLSLMNTNWLAIIDECARVVGVGGELWIAEIKSRFARAGARRAGGVPRHSVGFLRKGKQREAEEDESAFDNDREAEGQEGTEKDRDRDETDLTDFIAVLYKRGWSLMGEPDLSNRMFVRMFFVRFRQDHEIRGDGGEEARRLGKVAKSRFLDAELHDDQQSEAGILKPCLYKTR